MCRYPATEVPSGFRDTGWFTTNLSRILLMKSRIFNHDCLMFFKSTYIYETKWIFFLCHRFFPFHHPPLCGCRWLWLIMLMKGSAEGAPSAFHNLSCLFALFHDEAEAVCRIIQIMLLVKHLYMHPTWLLTRMEQNLLRSAWQWNQYIGNGFYWKQQPKFAPAPLHFG